MKQTQIYETLSSYRAPEMSLTEVSAENGFAVSGEPEPTDLGIDAPRWSEGVTGF